MDLVNSLVHPPTLLTNPPNMPSFILPSAEAPEEKLILENSLDGRLLFAVPKSESPPCPLAVTAPIPVGVPLPELTALSS